jgi:hypothetical protein
MTAETHPIEKELVMAYLDGELKPEQAARIAIHLDQCAECRELAAELRGVSSQLLAWRLEPAPMPLSDAVTAALQESEKQIRSGSPFQNQSRRLFWRNVLAHRWTWAAAGIVAATVCLVVLVLHPHYETAPQLASRGFSGRVMGDYLAADKLENEKTSENLNPTPPPDQIETQTSIGPMIARTASLNISVKNFDAARTSIDRIVRGHQGYVSSLNISTVKGAPQTLSAKVMIPTAQLDAALADLKALGRVEQEQQGGEEVTSQVVDLDARLKNARETETQLTEILRSRAGKIADVLDVEKEMARVRGEIEVMQAEQKQLRERVDFGSVDLNLSEEYQAQIGGGPWLAGRQIRNALVDGYHAAVDGLVNVCAFLLTVGPSLFLWGLLLFWPLRWAWRRWRKSRARIEASA